MLSKSALVVCLASCAILSVCASTVDSSLEAQSAKFYAKVSKVFESVGSDTSKLTEHHLATLRQLGFTDTDLKALKETTERETTQRGSASIPGASDDSMTASRFLQKRMKRARARQGGSRTALNVMNVVWPTPPSGYTATGFRFWIKAFIPGRDSDGSHLGYVNVNRCASGNTEPAGYPRDGWQDPYLFPSVAPMVGPLRQFIKGDA